MKRMEFTESNIKRVLGEEDLCPKEFSFDDTPAIIFRVGRVSFGFATSSEISEEAFKEFIAQELDYFIKITKKEDHHAH